jgi:hypothetical protein
LNTRCPLQNSSSPIQSTGASGKAELIDENGSPAVRSCFNIAYPSKNGRNLNHESKTVERDRIGQIHCTSKDGFQLESDPQINLSEIKATLNKSGSSNWLVPERSRQHSF